MTRRNSVRFCVGRVGFESSQIPFNNTTRFAGHGTGVSAGVNDTGIDARHPE